MKHLNINSSSRRQDVRGLRKKQQKKRILEIDELLQDALRIYRLEEKEAFRYPHIFRIL